jgi:hypothetical protein
MYTVYCRYCGALIPKKKAKRHHGHNFCPKKECKKLFFEISKREEKSFTNGSRVVPKSMRIVWSSKKKNGKVSFWKGF